MAPETATPTRADPATEAWRAIIELVGWGLGAEMRRVPRFPAVAAELDLSPKQLGVLLALEPGVEKPMGELSERLYCEASYMTDLVDRLERRGLVERRPDPEDRRVKRLATTTAGEELREAALARVLAPPSELTALSAPEQRTLRDLLQRALETGAGSPG